MQTNENYVSRMCVFRNANEQTKSDNSNHTLSEMMIEWEKKKFYMQIDLESSVEATTTTRKLQREKDKITKENLTMRSRHR